MFEKTLSDVIKGIRASKRDSPKYISQCIAEIRTELASSDMFVKANALEKLTFLQMMGYSMGFASFQATEVMSSPRFAHKRIGYLAASQSFTQDTEEVILAVNLLKKELRGAVAGGSQDVYNAGLAINCLSNIVTEELARDLLPELTNMLSHPQPYLRKKAILVLFKTFVRYPDGLRLTFNKLQQSLDDANSAVVSCAVNVITELSDKNPRNYLHLAPSFFQLLSRSSNNWMLIKVIKLLGSLVPEEPRLARKLLEPLADIVKNTQAKSLLFESVYTITLCLPYSQKSDGTMPAIVPSIVDLCADTLLNFVEENDQNLKYLGLVGFGSLRQSHPHVLSDPKYRPLILSCLSDEDETIRSRALELCPSITTRKNLTELVGQLMKHVESASGSYKIELVSKIIDMCSSDKYGLIMDFDWYLGVLFRLGHLGGVEKLGERLREQIISVALRVLPVRAAAVNRSMRVLLEDLRENSKNEGKQAVDPILPALAWIVGEYSCYIREAIENVGERFKSAYVELVRRLTDTNSFSPHAEKVYIQAAVKVTAAASADKLTSSEELEACIQQLLTTLPVFAHSLDVNVAMRATTILDMLDLLGLRSDGKKDPMRLGDLLSTSEKSDDEDPFACSGPQNAHSSSSLLCYLAKSSPMKPCGSKLQKRKSQADVGGGVKLRCESNESVFTGLIQEDMEAVKDRTLTIQSISFTSNDVPSGSIAIEHISKDMQIASSNETSVAMGQLGDAPKRRVDDPFYLDETFADPGPTHEANPPRFGAIKLLDSDSEGSVIKEKSKKAKKGRTKNRPHQQLMGVTMFDDDEDEDNGPRIGKGRRHGREFAGLAKVDLTAPMDQPWPESKLQKKKKMKKRMKVEKKSAKAEKGSGRQSQAREAAKPIVGDLLDLGGMIPGESTSAKSVHPVSSAFDAFTSPMIPASNTSSIHTTETDRLPWMKVIVKEQTSAIDMSLVEVSSVFRNSSTSLLQIRIANKSFGVLSDVSLKLEAIHAVMSFGSIQINDIVQREIQHGVQAEDFNRELKGSVVVTGQSFPVKLRLPFARCLETERKQLSLQDLAMELAIPGWISGTAKVPLSTHYTFPQAVETLQGFLNSAVVDVDASSCTAALASSTELGSSVRFLVKMKGSYVKVEVKAKQELIVNSTVADLKRLQL